MGSVNDSGLGREQWFGRVVLQTHDREVYSLGLYKTHATFAPGFTFKGYYLPCNPRVLPTGVVAHRSVPPKSAPVGVELTIDDSAFNAISEMLGAGIFCGGGAP